MKEYKTVSSASTAELVINRSRFIGCCLPVATQQEALIMLDNIRHRHWDASHNCFAYRIGENGNPARFSDDGEPSGTAGKPIMDALCGNGLTNVLVVVTRYFGGILLGAGGLMRAYSRSAADALANADVVVMKPAKLINIILDYARYSAIESYIRSMIQVENVAFTDVVTISGAIAADSFDGFFAQIVQLTDGRAQPQIIGETRLAVAQ
ncbi:MAG: YigZ family protein [Clostridia bacterium]